MSCAFRPAQAIVSTWSSAAGNNARSPTDHLCDSEHSCHGDVSKVDEMEQPTLRSPFCPPAANHAQHDQLDTLCPGTLHVSWEFAANYDLTQHYEIDSVAPPSPITGSPAAYLQATSLEEGPWPFDCMGLPLHTEEDQMLLDVDWEELLQLPFLENTNGKRPRSKASSENSQSPPIDTRRASKRPRLKPNQVAVLKTWLSQHRTYPFPTEDEKSELSLASGLTVSQVRWWFARTRQRKLSRRNVQLPKIETSRRNHQLIEVVPICSQDKSVPRIIPHQGYPSGSQRDHSTCDTCTSETPRRRSRSVPIRHSVEAGNTYQRPAGLTAATKPQSDPASPHRDRSSDGRKVAKHLFSATGMSLEAAPATPPVEDVPIWNRSNSGHASKYKSAVGLGNFDHGNDDTGEARKVWSWLRALPKQMPDFFDPHGHGGFWCAYCLEPYDTHEDLAHHFDVHSYQSPCWCFPAERASCDEDDSREHVCSATIQKRFSCTVCKAALPTKRALDVHSTWAHFENFPGYDLASGPDWQNSFYAGSQASGCIPSGQASVASAGSYASLGARRGRRVIYDFAGPAEERNSSGDLHLPSMASCPDLRQSQDAGNLGSSQRQSAQDMALEERENTGLTILYQCTFCRKELKTKYLWRRHEESSHHPEFVWICGNGPGRPCPKCPPAEMEVSCTHGFPACWSKPELDRTFYRKDALVQHLSGVHSLSRAEISQFVNDSKKDRPPDTTIGCPFCPTELPSWASRVDHVADHFKAGERLPEVT